MLNMIKTGSNGSCSIDKLQLGALTSQTQTSIYLKGAKKITIGSMTTAGYASNLSFLVRGYNGTAYTDLYSAGAVTSVPQEFNVSGYEQVLLYISMCSGNSNWAQAYMNNIEVN